MWKAKREWNGEDVREEVFPGVWGPWHPATEADKEALAQGLGVLLDYQAYRAAKKERAS